ncbi:MAG: pentapeptide repeat-containing protein, partial [Sulfuricurvum sp.]|nr:pentapeptide repeat-containing protein [Sulfuricurvum sp.]
ALFWKGTMMRSDLTHIHARGANFKGTHLEKSNLRFADFRGTKSWKANFSDALLEKTDFTNSELGDSKFIHNDLRTAKLSGSLLWQTFFNNVKMTKGQCVHAKKEEAILDTNVTCH